MKVDQNGLDYRENSVLSIDTKDNLLLKNDICYQFYRSLIIPTYFWLRDRLIAK